MAKALVLTVILTEYYVLYERRGIKIAKLIKMDLRRGNITLLPLIISAVRSIHGFLEVKE